MTRAPLTGKLIQANSDAHNCYYSTLINYSLPKSKSNTEYGTTSSIQHTTPTHIQATLQGIHPENAAMGPLPTTQDSNTHDIPRGRAIEVRRARLAGQPLRHHAHAAAIGAGEGGDGAGGSKEGGLVVQSRGRQQASGCQPGARHRGGHRCERKSKVGRVMRCSV